MQEGWSGSSWSTPIGMGSPRSVAAHDREVRGAMIALATMAKVAAASRRRRFARRERFECIVDRPSVFAGTDRHRPTARAVSGSEWSGAVRWFAGPPGSVPWPHADLTERCELGPFPTSLSEREPQQERTLGLGMNRVCASTPSRGSKHQASATVPGGCAGEPDRVPCVTSRGLPGHLCR